MKKHYISCFYFWIYLSLHYYFILYQKQALNDLKTAHLALASESPNSSNRINSRDHASKTWKFRGCLKFKVKNRATLLYEIKKNEVHKEYIAIPVFTHTHTHVWTLRLQKSVCFEKRDLWSLGFKLSTPLFNCPHMNTAHKYILSECSFWFCKSRTEFKSLNFSRVPW